MFEGEVQTLTQEVCGDCNQHFGDTLDLFLTRDSAEAMFRFRYGLKDPAEVLKMFKRRVRVTLPRDGSMYGGAHLDLIPPPKGESEPFLDLVTQYGCERKDGKGWDYFTEQQLGDPAVLQQIMDECGPNCVVFYNSPDARDRLLQLLTDLSVPLRQHKETKGFPPFESGRLNAWLQVTFDGALARAVAKIGFNYFTKTQGVELALRPAFDPLRRFVRYDEGRPPDFVQFGPAPVLRDREGNPLPTRGHLVTVGWDADGVDMLARVSPFQHIIYLVRLCERYPGVVWPFESAHLYDLTTRRAEHLAAAKLILPSWDQSRRLVQEW
jgi:hypothetical protein